MNERLAKLFPAESTHLKGQKLQFVSLNVENKHTEETMLLALKI